MDNQLHHIFRLTQYEASFKSEFYSSAVVKGDHNKGYLLDYYIIHPHLIFFILDKYKNPNFIQIYGNKSSVP